MKPSVFASAVAILATLFSSGCASTRPYDIEVTVERPSASRLLVTTKEFETKSDGSRVLRGGMTHSAYVGKDSHPTGLSVRPGEMWVHTWSKGVLTVDYLVSEKKEWSWKIRLPDGAK